MFWFALYLGAFCSFVLIARLVVRFLNSREQSSDFFREAVETEYVLQFPDKERAAYELLKSRLREKKGPLDEDAVVDDALNKGDEKAGAGGGEESEESKRKKAAEAIFMRRLDDKERLVLVNGLRPVMRQSIENMAKLQKDRPGYFRLWKSKLVSEDFWESLKACEEEVGQEIKDLQDEVDRIKAGQGAPFFREVLAEYRRAREQEKQARDLEQELDEKKRRLAQLRQKQAQQEVKMRKEIERREKERERALQTLLLEEEREISKKNKKGSPVLSPGDGGAARKKRRGKAA
ncbi:unnamed protein product [Amoebophrya sp. A25]|nr:unnamed protein product [Amoebophrya sp. A25]|eukprot:GSA25T00006844001.1